MSDHSRANILVVEDEIQLEKILSIRDHLPHLRHIIQYSGKVSGAQNKLLPGMIISHLHKFLNVR